MPAMAAEADGSFGSRLGICRHKRARAPWSIAPGVQRHTSRASDWSPPGELLERCGGVGSDLQHQGVGAPAR
jgi:hypothetical protein